MYKVSQFDALETISCYNHNFYDFTVNEMAFTVYKILFIIEKTQFPICVYLKYKIINSLFDSQLKTEHCYPLIVIWMQGKDFTKYISYQQFIVGIYAIDCIYLRNQ